MWSDEVVRVPRRVWVALTLGATALLGASCRPSKSERSAPRIEPGVHLEQAVPSAAAGASEHGAELAPLSNAEWLERLALPDGESAVVAVPLGARQARPMVVGVHGARDRPEWSCGGWRLAMKAFAFVICPQGKAVSEGAFGWPNSASIERSVLRAIDAVRARFGVYVAPGPATYAGFSQGAILAEAVLRRHASLFPRAIFAEGGYGTLASAQFAREYRANGGHTLIIVCGTPGCRAQTAPLRGRLQDAGLNVYEGGDLRSGHNLNQLMQLSLERDWPRWIAADPAWARYVP